MWSRGTLVLFGGLLGLATGCRGDLESDDMCPIGTEGCPCTGGGGCDQGLECVSQTCASDETTSGDGDGDGDSDGPCTGTNDPELVRYDEDGDRCYALYSPDYVSGNLAASNCEQWYGEGLAEVGSAAEHSLLTEFVTAAGPYKGMWIGLRRDDPDEAFTWASGDPVDFELWGTDQPNHEGPATCVYMYVGGDLYWHDDSCTLEEVNGFAYTCEWSP